MSFFARLCGALSQIFPCFPTRAEEKWKEERYLRVHAEQELRRVSGMLQAEIQMLRRELSEKSNTTKQLREGKKYLKDVLSQKTNTEKQLREGKKYLNDVIKALRCELHQLRQSNGRLEEQLRELESQHVVIVASQVHYTEVDSAEVPIIDGAVELIGTGTLDELD